MSIAGAGQALQKGLFLPGSGVLTWQAYAAYLASPAPRSCGMDGFSASPVPNSYQAWHPAGLNSQQFSQEPPQVVLRQVSMKHPCFFFFPP